MRAMTFDDNSANPTESFLRVLDQFAALRTYSSAAPVVGGYRVLTSRPAARRKSQFSILAPAAVAALARARMRLTGFLSVLFIGGLGLAVLAGPASCPCSNAFTVAEQDTALTRLGYVENARLVTARETAPEPPTQLAEATFLDPQRSMTDLSPIITSAIEPRAVPAEDAAQTAAVSPADRLAETFASGVGNEQPQTVEAAAAPAVKSELPPATSAAEVSTPPMTKLAAIDADEEADLAATASAHEGEAERDAANAIDDDGEGAHGTSNAADDHRSAARELADDDEKPARRAHAPRKRAVIRAYRSPNHALARAKARNAPDAQNTPRAPKWAQQMFNNPWQSQAFSYTR